MVVHAGEAHGQSRWALCAAPMLEPLAEDPAERDQPDTPIRLQAKRGEVSSDPPIFQFDGQATLTRADQTLRGESLTYDRETGQATAVGEASLRESGLLVEGQRAQYWLDEDRGRFQGVSEYRLVAGHLQGSAEEIIREDAFRSRYRNATLSTCLPEAELWQLRATTVTLDNETRQGRAWNAVLAIGSVPVAYTPYLQFPIGDERLTGFLTPTISQRSAVGTTLILPWYWNIAPNYDATITPTYYSKRGLFTDVEFRYLEPWAEGEVNLSFLSGDDERDGEDRWAINQEHAIEIGDSLSAEARQQRVSDTEFSNDFGDDFSYRSARFLENDAEVQWTPGDVRARVDAQYWQRIDPNVSESAQPLAREPRVRVDYEPSDIGPLEWSLSAESTEFSHPDSNRTRGRRTDLNPRLALSRRELGYFVEPAVSWRYTEYDLRGALPGDTATPSRSMPIYSIDAGVFLERPVTSFPGTFQTLEPRIFYRRAPTRDQDSLPNFDSSDRSLTLSSMFRENLFSGKDRIEDGERVSLEVTSHLVDSNSGEEYVRLSGGQAFYRGNRTVVPRGETDRTRSEYFTELRLSHPDGHRARVDYSWDPERSGTRRLRTDLRWRGSRATFINLSLRRRERDGVRTLDQASTSLTAPIAQGWRVFAGMTQDLEASQTRSRFYGVQQAGCCHALRLINREFLQRDRGADRAELEREIMLELELRGLGGIGDRLRGFISSEIDGYNLRY